MSDTVAAVVLGVALEATVPLYMAEVAHYSDEMRRDSARRCAAVIAEKGDVLQYGGKGCREAFDALALGLAIAAHVPGGVTFQGRRWDVSPPAPETASRSPSPP